MNEDAWKEEYKGMKILNPVQIKLLDEGAITLSQTWLLNSMWCDWKQLKESKTHHQSKLKPKFIEIEKDPWD